MKKIVLISEYTGEAVILDENGNAIDDEFKIVIYGENTEDECPVCGDRYENGEEIWPDPVCGTCKINWLNVSQDTDLEKLAKSIQRRLHE